MGYRVDENGVAWQFLSARKGRDPEEIRKRSDVVFLLDPAVRKQHLVRLDTPTASNDDGAFKRGSIQQPADQKLVLRPFVF